MKQQTWRHLAMRSTVAAVAVLSFSAWAGAPSFKEAPALNGDGNFCVGQDDGNYEHPDCRMHYSCKKGLASQVACPTGQVFDAAKNPNDDPSISYCSAPETVTHLDCSGVNLVR